MRMPALILTVIAATMQMAPASAADAVKLSRQKQIDESANKIKELQKERIDALKELVATNTNLFQSGRIDFSDVIDAQLQLLDAELEVAEKESDRVTLYKNLVDVLKQYEAVALDLQQRALGTHATVLKIKAKRLETEIRFEQAKARQAKESK